MELKIDNDSFLFVPWMNPENWKECMDSIKNSSSRYCCGHFEISGFYMNDNYKITSRLKKSVFKNFEKVISGHFHLQQENGNIWYPGTPYELKWQDFDTPKGFVVFENGKFDFVSNPDTIHKKITFNDKLKVTEEEIKDKICKIYLPEKYSKKKYDLFINKIESEYKVFDYEVIPSATFKDVKLDTSKGNGKTEDDFPQLMDEYVEESDYEYKKQTTDLLLKLYSEVKQ